MAKRSWAQSFSDLCRRNVPTGVQTAQRYLELANQCMEHVQSASTSLQFNHCQCKLLLDKLTVAVQNAEVSAQSDPSGFESKCLELVKLLWRSAKEVESFTQGCCKDNWIQAAIVFGNTFESVSSLTSNLDICAFLLLNDNTLGTTPNRDHHLDALSKRESKAVTEIVSSDQSKLLTRLGALILSGNSSDEDCQLALCLSGRLCQYLGGSVQLQVWNIDFSSLRQLTRLGSGSAGSVSKSIWLGEEVAEKVFYGSDHSSFMNEVDILAGLAHPNIVPLLGYAVDEGRCSIIMELMDEDLLFHMEARLRNDASCKTPFTLFEAVDMMLQTAEGMLYLHDNNVVHRDLKSQNILVKRRRNIDVEYVYLKVADFGLSKTKEKSITHSNQTPNMGTPRWMAPELMVLGPNHQALARHPFKADIYSFGMVCYEILTGKVPFSTEWSIKKVREKVLAGDRPILPDECPQTLKTLIHSCWDSEASLRPSFEVICKRLRSLRCSHLIGHKMRTESTKSKNIFTTMIGKLWEPSPSSDGHLDDSEILSQSVTSGDAISTHRTPPATRGRPYRSCFATGCRLPNGLRPGAPAFKGVRQRVGVRGYLVEIRPPKWKRTIWLGTYNKDWEAAAAYDAGIFYTKKKTSYNFPQLGGTFPQLPSQLCLSNPDDSHEIKTFVQNEAQLAVQQVKMRSIVQEFFT